MNNKKAKIMLNVSLVLIIAYFVLFFAGYFRQVPLFRRSFGGEGALDDSLKPTVSFLLIGSWLVIIAGIIAANIRLQKNPTGLNRIVAAFAAVASFILDRVGKSLVPRRITAYAAEYGGELDIVSAKIHKEAVVCFDRVLVPLFAVSLILMVFAACVIRNKLQEK